jgi:hypothetical protein
MAQPRHPGEMPTCDFVFNTMANLAKAHQAELSA